MDTVLCDYHFCTGISFRWIFTPDELKDSRKPLAGLLKKLIDNKVPVNAVGIQGHWSLYEPSREDLVATIKKFASLGIKIQVTELDVSVYRWEKNTRALRPGEKYSFTPELEEKQMQKYRDVFEVFRKYRNVITGVTFWNISDRHTWLDSYPVAGRKTTRCFLISIFSLKRCFGRW